MFNTFGCNKNSFVTFRSLNFVIFCLKCVLIQENTAVKRDHFPLPKIEENTRRMLGAIVF